MRFQRIVTCLVALTLCLGLFGCMASQEVHSPASTTATTVPETTAPPTTLPAVTLPDHVEVFREGESSQIPVETVQGTVGDYLIAIDPEYFTFSSHETVDMFSYDGWDYDMPVYFCVSAYEKEDPQEFIDDVIGQFGSQYQAIDLEDTTIGSYRATAVYLRRCTENTDYHKHVFLIDCGAQKYILEAQFVTEMYEGLYAIMRALFDTFTAL